MTATTKTTGRAGSPTGYEAFIEDSNETSFDMAKIEEKAPMLVTVKAQAAEESWTKSITTGAQSVITNYFPPKSPCEDNASPCGAVPDLAASSSSEKSGLATEAEEEEPSKGTLSSWADKMSSTCQMNTTCGKLDIEFMQKVEEPEPSRGNALTEQGELLKIEGAPPPTPPKPWTEELSDKVQEAQTVVSSKAKGLFIALGFSAKKNQALMTDFYNAKLAQKEEPEKSQSEKMPEGVSQTAQNVSSSVTSISSTAKNLLATGMSTLGLGPKEENNKEKKQTLITEYNSNRSETLAAASFPGQHDEIPDVVSIATEPTEMPQEEEKSSSWNLWKQFKGFMSKFKLPEKTSTCEAPTVPETCTTSKVELPSFSVFSCNPKTFGEEPTKAAEEVKAEETKKVEVVKVEETEKAEEVKEEETEKAKKTEPKSPKESNLPW